MTQSKRKQDLVWMCQLHNRLHGQDLVTLLEPALPLTSRTSSTGMAETMGTSSHVWPGSSTEPVRVAQHAVPVTTDLDNYSLFWAATVCVYLEFGKTKFVWQGGAIIIFQHQRRYFRMYGQPVKRLMRRNKLFPLPGLLVAVLSCTTPHLKSDPNVGTSASNLDDHLV